MPTNLRTKALLVAVIGLGAALALPQGLGVKDSETAHLDAMLAGSNCSDANEPDYFCDDPALSAVLLDDDGSKWKVVARSKPWGTGGAIFESDTKVRLLVRNELSREQPVSINVTYYGDDATHHLLSEELTLAPREVRDLDVQFPETHVLGTIRINDLIASVSTSGS